MTPIFNARSVYPIGEFFDGSRLCASVSEDGAVDWFPEHRDFDLEVMDAADEARYVPDEDVKSYSGEIPDDAPTLRSVPELGIRDMDLDWEN